MLASISNTGRAVSLFVLSAASIFLGNAAFAGEVTYPIDSYDSGQLLDHNDLNGKFNEIKTVVNGNAAIVSFVSDAADIELRNDSKPIQKANITTTGPGKVIVSFSATYTMLRTDSLKDQIWVGISDDSANVDVDVDVEDLPSKRRLLIDGLAEGEFVGFVASQAVFTVDSSGEHNFTVWGKSNDSIGFKMYVSYRTTQAIFVPHPYP